MPSGVSACNSTSPIPKLTGSENHNVICWSVVPKYLHAQPISDHNET